MRRRVVCPRSHPASPHLREHFVGFAVTRGISRGCPAARPASPRRQAPGRPGFARGGPGAVSPPPVPLSPLHPHLSRAVPARVTVRLGHEITSAAGKPVGPLPHHAPRPPRLNLLCNPQGARIPPWPFLDQQTGAFGRAEPAELFQSEINYFLVITESGYPGLVITESGYPGLVITESGYPGLVITESGYSGLLNVTMATPIMTSPMTATIPRHSPIGTTQPPQVRPGDRACMADGGRLRWVNTACLMGYTM